MEKYPYILFGSPPVGPIALQALKQAHYPPMRVVDDPKLTTEEQIAIVEEEKPTFILVVGYGAILKKAFLETVCGQVLNIHPSYLPLYRGPAPVIQTILDGVKETGVTLMQIDPKMDHGKILAQTSHALAGNETPDQLYRLLIHKGVELFLENIETYIKDELELTPQNHDEATFTHFIKKEDGLMDLSQPATVLERQIRAYQGWPRSWVIFNGKRLIIEKAFIYQNKLRFIQVQPENGKSMPFKPFLAGIRMKEEEFYALLSGKN